MTTEDKTAYYNATTCHICQKKFNDDKNYKVRDHDHRTGEFRGAAHAKCNINYFCNRYLPVVMHNFKGYDSHLIIQQAYEINKQLGNKRIGGIPTSFEKFMSVTIGDIRFIDSLQFMASSLEKLVENLYDEKDKFKNFTHMKKFYNEHMELLCQKGYYPYEWMDDMHKLKYDGLPAIDQFYSHLQQKPLTNEEYDHAVNVYKKLNCKTFEDYHLTYLKCDVLLLADVFENFRKTSLETYGLDPAHYYSAPGLAWDALLLCSKIQLDLITDLRVLDLLERQKRGGLCFVGSKRHVKANNKYLKDYDSSKPSNYLMYWDANNLYGWAMCEYLPFKNLYILEDVPLKHILNTRDDAYFGYIVECDLEFPVELHDLFKEFPPCPETLTPDEEWLSPFQKEIAKDIDEKLGVTKKGKYKGTDKLVPHLYEHKKYVIHYRNLKKIVKLGVNVKNIHQVLTFQQKPWMKPYIELNTEKCKQAKNEFEKDFYKLMNNAVFGKTMENVKNRIDLKLVTDHNKIVKLFSSIYFKECSYKNLNGLHLIEMYKDKVKYDKPVYVGTSILDLSKLHMMNFHYDVIHENFKDNYNLLYSDTDSFVYSIQHDDIYEWIKNNPK